MKIPKKFSSSDSRLKVVRYLAQRDGGCKCSYCLEPVKPSHIIIEHVKPLSRGGSRNEDNVVLSCLSCNSEKSSMDLYDFNEKTSRARAHLMAELRRRNRQLRGIKAVAGRDVE